MSKVCLATLCDSNWESFFGLVLCGLRKGKIQYESFNAVDTRSCRSSNLGQFKLRSTTTHHDAWFLGGACWDPCLRLPKEFLK